MSKIMTLEILSSIKGAESSLAVEELFAKIKGIQLDLEEVHTSVSAVELDSLRDDVVISSPEKEKQIIIDNFPKEKNGYLVVSKVIDN